MIIIQRKENCAAWQSPPASCQTYSTLSLLLYELLLPFGNLGLLLPQEELLAQSQLFFVCAATTAVQIEVSRVVVVVVGIASQLDAWVCFSKRQIRFCLLRQLRLELLHEARARERRAQSTSARWTRGIDASLILVINT